MTYLGEIQALAWLVGLIKYTSTSIGYFGLVFILCVTGFADSFAALDIKSYFNGDIEIDALSDENAVGFKTWFNRWLS